VKILPKSKPWYHNGLAFECIRCGRCCAGPGEGYVWVRPEEIEAAAEHLGMSVEEFRQRYTRRVGRRVSLIEDQATKDCIFLSRDEKGLPMCLIYPVRPTQCRTWPFWPTNLISPAAWNLAGIRCPGINRGPLHPLGEIEGKSRQTRP